jgi:hypothetical protein
MENIQQEVIWDIMVNIQMTLKINELVDEYNKKLIHLIQK